MVELVRLSAGAPVAEIIATIERDGGVIVEDFIEPALLARLNADLDAHVAAKEPGSKSPRPEHAFFHGANTKRLCGLAAKSPAFVDFMLDTRLKAYADHFLLPSCGEYWVNTGQMMVVGPGEPAQYPHRDDANWPHFPWPHAELTVSGMFALEDFTQENGATVVVPGSHKWTDPTRMPEAQECCQAVMKAGSAMLYTGTVIHGAGENRTSDVWRRGMHLSFVLGWLRAEEAHQIHTPLEVARSLPERAQALLGFDSYHPADPAKGGRLGLVDFDDAAFFVRAVEAAE